MGESLLDVDEGYGADFRIVFGRDSGLEFQFRAATGQTFSFAQEMLVAAFGNADSFGRHPRESRMDGKSREAVELNSRLENLLLSIQAAYQSLLSKGCVKWATF